MASSPSQPPQTSPTLPTISLHPFLHPSPLAARQQTAHALATACTHTGFFYLTDHGIPAATLARVLELARAFFALPLEEKLKIKRKGVDQGGDGARGYQAVGENVTQGRRDVHEGVDWYREWGERGGEGDGGKEGLLRGPNLWPEEPEELKEVYQDYIAQVLKVGTAVVRAMGMGLGLPLPGEAGAGSAEGEGEDGFEDDADVFVRATDQSFWVMRMIGYPPLSQDDTAAADPAAMSCGTHTDYGCVTLLLADATRGALQVLRRDGTWLDADPVSGAFVVNIGDMMERWTGGRWKSTKHRVVHRGEGFRVSVPFFFEPNWDVVVKPLKGVGEKGDAGGEGEETYGEYLLKKVGGNFYGSEEG